MSVPTLLSMCCRSSYDCSRDVSLIHQHSNNVVVCRHSTGSYATSSSTHTGEGLVDVPPLSRVSIDTVSSLGDVFHDAGRLSRRSLVGRDYENTHHHHGVTMDLSHHHHASVSSPGMIDVAYSNVAAILAMDGASIRSYPWVASNVAPSRSDDDVHDERCCSHDEMKSPTMHMDGVLTRSSVAMLQNALETALSRETGMNE